MANKKSKIAIIILLIVAVLSVAGVVVTLILQNASTKVPDLSGMTLMEAIQCGQESELVVKDGQKVDGDKEDTGKVMEQYPAAGTEAKAGDIIMVNICRGLGDGRTPNVIDMSTDEAKNAIESAGFKVGSINQVAGAAKAGTVLDQNPKGNKELEKGKRISIDVSDGTMVYVPNVIGMDVGNDYAGNKLYNAGLKVEYYAEVFSDRYPSGAVCKQSPGPGALVKHGTTVRLWVSLGSEDDWD